MMCAALALQGWAKMLQENGSTPYQYVDDLLFLTEGDGHEGTFNKAMDLTHQYVVDMGAKVSAEIHGCVHRAHKSATKSKIKFGR